MEAFEADIRTRKTSFIRAIRPYERATETEYEMSLRQRQEIQDLLSRSSC
jgi:hypothetical protein